MPHDYSPQTRTFTTPDGRTLTRRDVRAKLEKVLDYLREQSAKIARRFDAGETTAEEMGDGLRELLRASHIVAATVGKGGREQMSSRDWGKVGAKVRWQNGFVDKFVKDLKGGKLSKAATVSRAKSYSSAVYVTYATAESDAAKEVIEPKGEEVLVRLITNSEEGCEECAADEAAGWMKPDDMTEIGGRLCQDFCKCTFEWSDE